MIAIANDHVGLELKKELISLLDSLKLPYKDFGAETCERIDYPRYAYPAAKAVAAGECEKGILICGTGVGMSLVANKVHGIRCVVCSDCYSAKLSREHNNTNMLAIGARVIGPDLAKMIVEIWLETPFEGGRHQNRIDQISGIEEGIAPSP
jgi:ribose 5-phosphate isomerase B